jgi:RNA polymerase sigma factor (sigma-70 family)
MASIRTASLAPDLCIIWRENSCTACHNLFVFKMFSSLEFFENAEFRLAINGASCKKGRMGKGGSARLNRSQVSKSKQNWNLGSAVAVPAGQIKMSFENPGPETERFLTQPAVTDMVRAAKTDPNIMGELGEKAYKLVTKRMRSFVAKEFKGLDLDDLFTQAWIRMRKAVQTASFNNREHFVRMFCDNITRSAYTTARKDNRHRVGLTPTEVEETHRTRSLSDFAEYIDKLPNAVARLAVEERRLIECYYFEGKSCRVIATEMALDGSTVRRRRKRAEAALESILQTL